MFSRLVKSSVLLMIGAALTHKFVLTAIDSFFQNLVEHVGIVASARATVDWIGGFLSNLAAAPERGFWFALISFGATIGYLIGIRVHTWLRDLKEKAAGRAGGPSLFHLRCEAWLLRQAITRRWVRKLSGDFARDLELLNIFLTRDHGLAPMPTTSLSDPEALRSTADYLYDVGRYLRPGKIDEARRRALIHQRPQGSGAIRRAGAARGQR